MTARLCDHPSCLEVATVILYTERRYSSDVESYWCERHKPTIHLMANP